jgi:hypothetical protein
MKYDYYVKQVKPEDFKNFLRLSGGVGWKLVQVIILQRYKQASLIPNQMPQMEMLYECILIRKKNGEGIEDIEPDEEIVQIENVTKTNLKIT